VISLRPLVGPRRRRHKRANEAAKNQNLEPVFDPHEFHKKSFAGQAYFDPAS
jgi:hypothetical protein